MTEYFIGMHHFIDHKKFQRDYRSAAFTGIEFCNFNSYEEIQEIVDFVQQNGVKIGIHFPLNRHSYKFRDLLLLSLDEREREIAIAALVTELEVAKRIKADYLLIHFPKPMILNKNLEWHKCHFPIADQPIDETEYPIELFKQNAFELLSLLSQYTSDSGVQIVLEIELLNRYLYEGDLLKELLNQFSNIKICLYSARLNVLSKIDPSFNCMKFVEAMSPYTYLIHLSNIKVGEVIEQGHHPVLKRLDLDAGWFDVDAFLKVVSENNKKLKILYEHRSDIISDEELDDCYEWVSGYFKSSFEKIG